MKTSVILLVEDNPDDAELAIRAFSKTAVEHDMVLARDGVEALDYLLGTGPHAANPPAQPDVILLDLNLPRVDGLEVLRRIRADERTRCVPVVILSSSERDQDMVSSYDTGANSYVRKPVEFGRFLEAAQTLSAYWLTVNQAARPQGRP